MAGNLLPIIAVAAGVYFFMKKDSEADDIGDEASTGVSYTVIPHGEQPRTLGFMPDATDIWMRLEGGGDITEWSVDGPEGSELEQDLVREGGVGSTTVDLQIKKAGLWHFETVAKDPAGGADIHRQWNLDIQVLYIAG